MHPIIAEIVEAFEQRGSNRYGSEDVTQLEHALQSAQLAVEDDADATLVAAALLHDLGHILSDEATLPRNGVAAERDNLDDKHESRGYEYLKRHFGPAVADPVRLHVIAKRYLCTINPAYVDQLSPTSLSSYRDQGGEMTSDELAQFKAEPHFRSAVRLRYWDDAAKDSNAMTPPLEHFTPYVEASLPA